MGESPTWISNAPLVIAHRGASAFAPENTLAAFTLAADLGAHAIELDAKLSADGEVVVHHDLTLERTTNGEGRLQEKTLAELKELDAGSHFSVKFRAERIPTLGEVFEAVGQRVLINVELTNYASLFDRLVPAVIALVKEFSLEGRVLLSSFNPVALVQVRGAAPGIRTGLLLQDRMPRAALHTLEWLIPHKDLHPPASIVTSSLVDRQHEKGKRVHAWTVNDYDQALALINMGVDGIITDDPGGMMDVIGRSGDGHE